MGAGEWGMLFTLALLWGGSFFFIDVAVRNLPPLTLVLLRLSGAALTLNITVRLIGIPLPHSWRQWRPFFPLSLIMCVLPFSLISWGQIWISSGLASILNATTPLFTLVIAHFLTVDEKLSRPRVVAVVLGLSGIVVMIGTAALRNIGSEVLAQFAVLGAAMSYGFAGVTGRGVQSAGGLSHLANATMMVTCAALLVLPVALLVDQPWRLPLPGPAVWGSVLGLAVMSTALAYILYFRLLSTAGAVNLTLVTFLVPVTSIALGTLVLHERLYANHVFGMALIAAGLLAIDGRLVSWLRARAGSPQY
ncbi:MAG: ABC transporter permease [Gammaproteobacteria bacterium RIFCSPLOWO2_02_FULL_61_13]|nr:MAG: ABC transporter permease [Gammaproteobacteria bacterium RIFCSPLOWO2_02_FULL_61_13]